MILPFRGPIASPAARAPRVPDIHSLAAASGGIVSLVSASAYVARAAPHLTSQASRSTHVLPRPARPAPGLTTTMSHRGGCAGQRPETGEAGEERVAAGDRTTPGSGQVPGWPPRAAQRPGACDVPWH